MVIDFGKNYPRVKTFCPFNISIRWISDFPNPFSAICMYPHFYYELCWDGKMREENISEEAKQIQYFNWTS